MLSPVFFSFYKTGVLGGGRRNAIMALNNIISSTLLLEQGPKGMSGYILLLSWFIEISELNANIVDTGQRSLSSASDLGLHCLPMSILWDAKLKWIKLI